MKQLRGTNVSRETKLCYNNTTCRMNEFYINVSRETFIKLGDFSS